MKLDEFEKNLLFFVRNSKEEIIHSNVAYYFGIPSKEAKTHLESLADTGMLMLDSDDDGNLFYTMPNVPRKHDEAVLKSYFFGITKQTANQNQAVSVHNQRQCPFCMEPIRPNAKKCKHCGEIIDVTLLPARGHGGKAFPHIPHLVLSLISSGAWIIIWILHYIFRDKNKYD